MLTQNVKQKSQNYSQKPKADLKQRAYQYSIKLVKFIDKLPKDSSSQIIAKQLLRSGTKVSEPILLKRMAPMERRILLIFLLML